jgi:translation initiation factor IF-2
MSKSASQTIERPPVVVVMGHVDHGKSTLLDFIRKANTVEKEAGGITQHVAAYEVTHKDKRITFIDTPGHAAFTAIRARGANIADIAILVVAADDGVKAQTLEALAQIREAKIPFIVAINKIDKPNVNVERTQATLSEQGVYLENLGGDVPWTAISAKVGTGVDELLDLILLVAEVQEYKADPSVPAQGFVIEGHRDQKRGVAATLIITNGSIQSGMAVAAGHAVAPVRIMENHLGKPIKEASFSTPIRLVGFDELPSVGVEFHSFKNKREAETGRGALPAKAPRMATAEDGGVKKFFLPVVVRADTVGSLEALLSEVRRLGDEHSSVTTVQSGLGTISEGDVKTALSGEHRAIVIGFNTAIDPIAEALARERGVRIETFDIIYKLTEKLEELLREARPKRTVEEVVGRAKVLKQFSSRKDAHVIGGSVLEGYIARGASVRVTRRGTVIGVGKIKNLQAHKSDVDRVEAKSEFGAQIASPFEVAQGDTLECIVTTTV